jgi:hypothetical protein
MSTVSTWPADSLVRVCEEIDRDGFTTLSGVFDAAAVKSMLESVGNALHGVPRESRNATEGVPYSAPRSASTRNATEGAPDTQNGDPFPADPAIRGEDGAVYAARNLLEVWPAVATVWRRPVLVDVLARMLGPGFGLVRVLYFDKPPGQSWALPWHKDLVIAVRDNTLADPRFRKPTCKASVPHIEAPSSVLESMLTARIHLDPVTPENGPMKVVPGSHRDGKSLSLENAVLRTLYAEAGDVLLIRPLVAHCSNRSSPDTELHRRILHLEFAAGALPGGFEWHDFVR